ncbi:MAG: ferrochelatase [bacterium]
MSDTIGLLVMTYGSPSNKDDVRPYLKNIRKGKEPSDELVEKFKERYEIIGGSPLNEITRKQAEGAAEILSNQLENRTAKAYVGMHHWKPTIEDAVELMANDGIDQAVALIMSPQYSPILMKGYEEDLNDALESVPGAPEVNLVKEWWDNGYYHKSVAARIKEALDDYPESVREKVPLLLTAHSIPKRVDDEDPQYVEKLKKTAERIMQYVDHENWDFAYQSAGHTKEEWLKPDMTDLFPGFAEKGRSNVLIAPFQFLADHLEILYDIDVEAKKQAEEENLSFKRIPSLNDHQLLLKAMADAAYSELIKQSAQAS